MQPKLTHNYLSASQLFWHHSYSENSWISITKVNLGPSMYMYNFPCRKCLSINVQPLWILNSSPNKKLNVQIIPISKLIIDCSRTIENTVPHSSLITVSLNPCKIGSDLVKLLSINLGEKSIASIKRTSHPSNIKTWPLYIGLLPIRLKWIGAG